MKPLHQFGDSKGSVSQCGRAQWILGSTESNDRMICKVIYR
eukprot:CAMPEP_0202502370 /NCGR_PEP_ID=MMETSP1361-20130828/38768_1 /ASSEMBLY_ACC=CAM_ASM_000849 /TAXON_ID=210615 /ORGANISM="Staurosira complex sp., Strain CCMP2646" /LENGTH=40 /DNA_ID= /DNA_START= /DNA_END= /DNA_ORIENTATION=